MPDITERQAKLLCAIIDEYVKTAEPVGSETIVKNADLNVSPATIRNEMVVLAKQGFLSKEHASAGRAPTSLGFRYYIKNLMEEKKIPVVSEVGLRQRLWEKRFEAEKLIQDAVSALAQETHNLALATTVDGPFYYAGISNILESPEFFDIDLTKSVLDLLDQRQIFLDIFSHVNAQEPVAIMIGEECGIATLAPCGFVFSPYHVGQRTGYLGIVGPARMNYPSVIPTVRFISNLLEDLTRNW